MIDLGIGFEEAVEKSRVAPFPVGTYPFVVDEIEYKLTQAGRPRWVWWLKPVNPTDPTLANRRLPYGTNFPWFNPATGERDTSGIGFLTDMLIGIGARFEGTTLPEKETFYGKQGMMRVKQKPNRDDPTQMDNDVKILKR